MDSKSKARRQGKKDGRSGMPDLNRGIFVSPYIYSLNAQASQIVSELAAKITMTKQDIELGNLKAKTQLGSLDKQLSFLEKSLADIEANLDRAQSQVLGNQYETGPSRANRIRHLPGWIYILILVVLGVSELGITQPAFATVFQDLEVIAWISTIAFLALVVTYAHLMGIALRGIGDQIRPWAKWLLPTFILVGAAVLLGIYYIALLRAENIDALNFSKTAVILLFFVIQSVLLFLGILSSYYHHAPDVDEENKYKKQKRKLQNKIVQLTRKMQQLELGRQEPEAARKNAVAVANDHLIAVESLLETRAQIYWTANLHARSDGGAVPIKNLITKTLDYKLFE
jgi:uncharacterized membrane protein YhaH (DUF805 family)